MSVEQLKKALKEEKGTYGTDETIKKIKLGKIATVFIASDAKSSEREKVLHYKKQGDLEVFELELKSAEVGILCKKQFPVSMLSF